MRLIVAGSRSYHGQSIGIIKRAIAAAVKHWGLSPETEITELISGGAKGIDLLGEYWAKANKIPVKRFDADWNGEGKKAGVLRNREMLDYALQNQPAGAVIIHDGESKGTANMISICKQHPELLLFVGHPKP